MIEITGENGKSKIYYINYKINLSPCDEFTLQIFNRWGNLVWIQSQSSSLFIGRDLSGKDLVDGIYFFKLIFEKGEKSGFLHIIR